MKSNHRLPVFVGIFLTFLLVGSIQAADHPRLLVVISVDQMRADYLERFKGEFRGGFSVLLKNGAVFTRARHTHVPTETAPGHAGEIRRIGRSPQRRDHARE